MKLEGRFSIPSVMSMAESLFHAEKESQLSPDELREYGEAGAVAGSYPHDDVNAPDASAWRFWSDVVQPEDEVTDYWETLFFVPTARGEAPRIFARVLIAMDRSRGFSRIRWVNGK
jgi:hypothetical protein